MKRQDKIWSLIEFDSNVVSKINKEAIEYQFKIAKQAFIKEIKKKGYYDKT